MVRLAKAACPGARCRNCLRHKTLFADAEVLNRKLQDDIRATKGQVTESPVVQLRQEAGQFVLTDMGAFHWVINTGYNLNEAANVATDEWSSYMAKTKGGMHPCSCPKKVDAVQITPSDISHTSQGQLVNNPTTTRQDYIRSAAEARAKKRRKSHRRRFYRYRR